ncbi:MAG: antibiotic biosynthesis monooxygenase, partial [Bacteroidales bacterium]|nr:antibiotic biosynthesis monooxygenase [Bacteroidales bacterium]
MRNTIALILCVFLILSCSMRRESNIIGMCEKDTMSADGIVRLSKIEVYPQFLDEYIKYAVKVGEVSLRTEPGVLTMYAVQDKENPCLVTIL